MESKPESESNTTEVIFQSAVLGIIDNRENSKEEVSLTENIYLIRHHTSSDTISNISSISILTNDAADMLELFRSWDLEELFSTFLGKFEIFVSYLFEINKFYLS